MNYMGVDTLVGDEGLGTCINGSGNDHGGDGVPSTRDGGSWGGHGASGARWFIFVVFSYNAMLMPFICF